MWLSSVHCYNNSHTNELLDRIRIQTLDASLEGQMNRWFAKTRFLTLSRESQKAASSSNLHANHGGQGFPNTHIYLKETQGYLENS